MSDLVWVVSTAEPDHEVVGVFASREALDYEYPGMVCPHLDARSLVLQRRGSETLYAKRYPLHHFAGARQTQDKP